MNRSLSMSEEEAKEILNALQELDKSKSNSYFLVVSLIERMKDYIAEIKDY